MSDDNETVTLNTKQKIPPEYAGWKLPEAIAKLSGHWQTLVLTGGPGTRKTTQIWTIRRVASVPVHVLSESSDIDTNRFSLPHLDAWASFKGILCIDDIGYKKPTEWNVQVLFAVLSHRRMYGLKTILTTNHERAKLADLYGEPVASRVFADQVINVGNIDLRGKVEAASWNRLEPAAPTAARSTETKTEVRDPKVINDANEVYYRANRPSNDVARRWYLNRFKIQVGPNLKAWLPMFDRSDYAAFFDQVATLPVKDRTLAAAGRMHYGTGPDEGEDATPQAATRPRTHSDAETIDEPGWGDIGPGRAVQTTIDMGSHKHTSKPITDLIDEMF
jgi:hypothetical protein